jgi:hypothetical protein
MCNARVIDEFDGARLKLALARFGAEGVSAADRPS